VAPNELVSRRDVTFSLDGDRVVPSVLAPGPEDANGATARVLIEPATPISDRARVTVRYPLTSALAAEATGTTLVPLILPEQENTSQRVRALARRGTTISAVSAGWQSAAGSESAPRDASSDADELVAQFESDRLLHEISLDVRTPPRSAHVELAWIHSVLSGERRQDRVSYRLVTAGEPSVRISLPAGASANRVATWIDRDVVAPRISQAAGQIIVEIGLPTPRGANPRREANVRVLELLYDVESSTAFGPSLDPPRLLDDVWQSRTYWQVDLPGQTQVLRQSANYVNEYTWGWQPIVRTGDTTLLAYWGRKPNLTTASLQRMFGAPVGNAGARGRANTYLFSMHGPATPLELNAVPRALVVLVASGAALLAGLALLLLPRLRHPAALLVVASLLGGLALVSPPTAVLVAQAALLGVGLAVAAGIASWVVSPRSAEPITTIAPASDRIERGSGSGGRFARSDRSGATTLTAPADALATDSDALP
jgi:hypothetical protein